MKKRYFLLANLLFLMQLTMMAQNIWTAQPVNYPPNRIAQNLSIWGDTECWSYSMKLDSNNFFVVNDSRFNYTNNSGQTWIEMPLPFEPPVWVTNFSPLANLTSWVSGHSLAAGPQLFKTTDGGQTWEPKGTAGITVFLDFVHFFDDNEGLAVGDPDNNSLFEALKTMDGGATWTMIADRPQALKPEEYGFTGTFETLGDMVAYPTYENRIIVSFDRGNNWTELDSPIGLDGVTWDQAFLSDGTLFTSTSNFVDKGLLFRRKPTDAAWTELPNSPGFYIQSIESIPGTNTLIANFIPIDLDVNGIFETRLSYDLGDTWTTIKSDNQRTNFLDFNSASNGYSTEFGIFNAGITQMFKYSGSPISGLLDPKPLDVFVEIYPNPTTDLVKIDFKNAKNEPMWVLLNDAQGRLIEKKIIESTENSTVSFDLKNQPAGVYQLTLSSATGVLTRSVVRI
jgi:Secretion system C-terminal sorting domain